MPQITKTPPAFVTRHVSVPFTKKSTLNEWGSFDGLEVHAFQEEKTGTVISRWFLTSTKHPSSLFELNEIQCHQALLDYFYQTGKVSEITPTNSPTENEQKPQIPQIPCYNPGVLYYEQKELHDALLKKKKSRARKK